MRLDRYKFELLTTPVTPLTPANERLELSYQFVNKGRFFRRRLKTALRFIGADFVFFQTAYNANACGSYKIRISRKSAGVGSPWEVWHEGTLFLNTGNYDYDRGIVLYEIEPDDLYACFNRQLKKRVNLLQFGTPTKMGNIVGAVDEQVCNGIDTYEAGSQGLDGVIDCIPGGAAAGLFSLKSHGEQSTDVIPGVTVTTIGSTWIREIWPDPGPPPDNSWTLIGTNYYRRIPVVGGQTFFGTRSYGYEAGIITFDDQKGIDNGRLLKQGIEGAINAAGCGFAAVRSNFFGLNPSGPTPINAAYAQAALKLQNLFYFQRSDVLRWYVDNNATLLEITIEELLESLSKLFNLSWAIQLDAGNPVFRLEHVSYFERSQQIDFTATQYAPYIRGHNRFEADGRESVPRFEAFTAAGGRDKTIFAETRIVYPADCVSSENTQSIAVQGTTTDFEALFLADDNPNLLGMVIVAAYQRGTNYYIFQDYGYLNGCLSWWDLVRHYWLHERYAATATVETGDRNGPVTMLSLKRIKKQPELKIPISCATQSTFDPAGLHRTGLGWGEVQDATYDTMNETITIKLTY